MGSSWHNHQLLLARKFCKGFAIEVQDNCVIATHNQQCRTKGLELVTRTRFPIGQALLLVSGWPSSFIG